MKHFVVLCLVLVVALTVEARTRYDEDMDDFWKHFDSDDNCVNAGASCASASCCGGQVCSKGPPDFKPKCFAG